MNNEEKILHMLGEMRGDINEMRSDIAELKAGQARLDKRMDSMDSRLDRVEADTRWTRLEIENNIKSNIQKLADGHMQIIETMARKEDVDALREDWATERVALETLAVGRFGK